MRGVPESDESKSYVCWPTDWEHTGEGGLAVYLIVPDQAGRYWNECAVSMPTLKADAVIVRGQQEDERRIWGVSQYDTPPEERTEIYTETDLLACVCLGTTGGAWRDEEYGYFIARVGDLTWEGKQIYDSLKELYGIEPVLLTLLDT